MTGESAVPDYIAIIMRAIEKAQNDPAQLRRLVYDIARIGLGKQVLLSYREFGSAGLQQQLADLETAIKQVEIISHLESDLLTGDSRLGLIEGPRRSPGSTEIAAPDHFADSSLDPAWKGSEATRPNAITAHVSSGFVPSRQIWEPIYADPAKQSASRFRKIELPIAILIGLAIYVATLMQSGYLSEFYIQLQGKIPQSGALSAAPSASKTILPPAARGELTTQKPEFPLPSIYGVYALSQGKLYSLGSLAMRVPDPRVAISAMISNPSSVTIPDGQLSFVIYRRDLLASAPDTVPVRIVARVMRELKFSNGGPPKMLQINGEWAIRSKAIQLSVAPVKNNPEMIMLRPQNTKFIFPSGRYVLVFKGEGYDFSVAGQTTDLAQCLERTDALGGIVYSECRSLR